MALSIHVCVYVQYGLIGILSLAVYLWNVVAFITLCAHTRVYTCRARIAAKLNKLLHNYLYMHVCMLPLGTSEWQSDVWPCPLRFLSLVTQAGYWQELVLLRVL